MRTKRTRLALGLILGAGLLGGLSGCALCALFDPLPVVAEVDLERYAGLWYEVASYPVFFNEDCTGTTAEYNVIGAGRVSVLNRCFLGSLDGPLDEIVGEARVVDPAEPAKLQVSFSTAPFPGNYWIIMLDTAAYQWAVVGDPARFTLFILSRTPQLDPDVYAEILSRLPELGFDPNRLRETPQPAAP